MYISSITKNKTNMFKFNDGGRKLAGYKGTSADCVTRSIAIATKKPYQEVYDELYKFAEQYSQTRNNRVAKAMRNARSGSRRSTSPRTGVYKDVYKLYLKSLGWKWITCNTIGQKVKVHLDARELPNGRLICSVSKHLTTMINGVIEDTYNPQRKNLGYPNERMVYGYFIKLKQVKKEVTFKKPNNKITSITFSI